MSEIDVDAKDALRRYGIMFAGGSIGASSLGRFIRSCRVHFGPRGRTDRLGPGNSRALPCPSFAYPVPPSSETNSTSPLPKPLPAFSAATLTQRRHLRRRLSLAPAVPSGHGDCQLPVVASGCRVDYAVNASCLAGSCLPRCRPLLPIAARAAGVVCA
jgi:hypothetical protein